MKVLRSLFQTDTGNKLATELKFKSNHAAFYATADVLWAQKQTLQSHFPSLDWKNLHASSAAWFTAIMHLCLQNHNNFWFPSSFHLIKRSNINKTATALCWLILITIYSALHCQIYLILCHLVFNRVFAVPYVQLLMLWNARFRQKLKYHYIDNVWFFYKH